MSPVSVILNILRGKTNFLKLFRIVVFTNLCLFSGNKVEHSVLEMGTKHIVQNSMEGPDFLFHCYYEFAGRF